MYGCSTCAAGNGLNGVLQMRREQSPSAFEHLRRTRGAGAREKSRGQPALRRPAGVQKLRLRPVDPAFQNPRREAPADAGGARGRLGIEPQQSSRQIRDAEGGEEARRMESALVKLSGRDAAGAAGDLVADGDGCDQIAPCDAPRVRQCERGRHGRAAHVHDRLVVRVVVLERLRERAVRKRRHRHVQSVARAENATRAGRRHRDGRVANRSAERRLRSRKRQPDDVEDTRLRRADDIGRQIVKADACPPLGEG